MSNQYDHFLWFDPNIDCSSPTVNEVVALLKTEIQDTGKFTRWHERYSEHLRIIVLNLFNTAFIDQSRYVAYSRNKSDYTRLRKDPSAVFKMAYNSMVNMVDALKNDLGYIEGVNGFNDRVRKYSRSAKMRATEKLIDLCLGRKVCPYDIGGNPAAEVIILKAYDNEIKDDVVVEYADNDVSKGMRKNLQIINRLIQCHFIGLSVCDNTLAEINKKILGFKIDDYDSHENYHDEYESEIENNKTMPKWKTDRDFYTDYLDQSKKTLKRIFSNGSFEEGGRFYGGWWQAVPGRYRPYISIDDKPTIEIDYSGIHINLLYMLEGLPIPPDDVYTIEGLPKEIRNVMKIALQILLNSKIEARALWSMKRHEKIKKYDRLLKEITYEKVVELFKEKHKAIEKYFFSGIGIKLQFIDSQIAEDILLNLEHQGIVALPIHDSFIVKKENEEELRAAMDEAVIRRFGQTLRLKEDKSAYDLDREFLAWNLSPEDVPSLEEYKREWISEKRYDYLSRRDHWYLERNL